MEPWTCDRPGCGRTFVPSVDQRYNRRSGHFERSYCSVRCADRHRGQRQRERHAAEQALALSEACLDRAWGALCAEVRGRERRGEPLYTLRAVEFRAPTEAELASTAA